MEQMDPNNISGLLKLHLRENHLLSSKIIANVTEVLSSAPKDETVSNVKYMSSNNTQKLEGINIIYM